MKIDELIRDLKYTVLHLPWSQIRKDADEVVDRVVQTLEAQQARIAQLEAELKEERRWIPVGERLPKIQLWCEDDDDGVHTRYYRSTPVAVYWDGDCCKAEYHESRDVIGGRETNAQVCWISGDHGGLDGVTHWMPLPEPPKEDS